LPYLVCQACGFRAYSAVGHTSVEGCPVCGTPFPLRRGRPDRLIWGGGEGGTSTPRSRASLRREIEDALGRVPEFFELALADTRVGHELWRRTRSEWFDGPMPFAFRKALLDALVASSPWPWRCVADIAAFQPADDEPPSDDESWPGPGSPLHDELVGLAVRLVDDGPDEQLTRRLIGILGEQQYASLVATLTYLEACATFARAHPELAAAGAAQRDPVRSPHTAVIEIDAGGKITSFGAVAEMMFGYAREAITGRPLTDLFETEGREPLERLMSEFGEERENPVRKQSLRLTGCRSDGTGFEARITLANRTRDGRAGEMTAIVEPVQALPAREDLDRAAAHARLAFEGAPVGMALVDVDANRRGLIAEVNRALCVITERAPTDLVGHSLDDITHASDRELDTDLIERLLAGEIPAYQVDKRFVRANGDCFWGELHVSLIRDDGNHAPRFLVVQLADVSERKRVEDALRASSDRFAGIFDDAPVGMGVATLERQWIQVNEALCATLGYTEAELLNKPISELIVPEEIDTIKRYLRQLLAGEVFAYHVETRAVRGDGRVIWTEVSVSLVHDYHGEPAYIFVEVRDISERKRLEEELEQGTLVDPATRLPSRVLLFDRLDRARVRVDRSGSSFALIYVQAEGLDEVEDRLGSERGEAALRELSSRLVAAVRAVDTVARYGPCEFVVLCEDLASPHNASALTERLLGLCRFNVGESDRQIEVAVTAGLTVAASSDDAPAVLVQRGDAALQAARTEGAGYQEYCEPL
jgi:PAS domain S-box-containing protein/diguanylate cyclase (GGDEF)-like protein